MDLKGKVQLVLNVCGNITQPYLITIDSTKHIWLHSNMYFQINESIPVTYFFITYYLSTESFIVEPKSIHC
jgi:hypothetical protein